LNGGGAADGGVAGEDDFLEGVLLAYGGAGIGEDAGSAYA
jgi:hypothetical protein